MTSGIYLCQVIAEDTGLNWYVLVRYHSDDKYEVNPLGAQHAGVSDDTPIHVEAMQYLLPVDASMQEVKEVLHRDHVGELTMQAFQVSMYQEEA